MSEAARSITYSNAIRRLCRRHNLSWSQVVDRFGARLIHVRCNIVTMESVEACEAESDAAGSLLASFTEEYERERDACEREAYELMCDERGLDPESDAAVEQWSELVRESYESQARHDDDLAALAREAYEVGA